MAKKVAVTELDSGNKLIIYKKFLYSQPQFTVVSKKRVLFLFWRKSKVAAHEVNSIGGLQYYTFKSLDDAQSFSAKIKSEY